MKNVRINYTMVRLGIYESLLEEAIEDPHITEDQRRVLSGMQREMLAVKARREEEIEARKGGADIRVCEIRVGFTPEELEVYAGLLSEAAPLNEVEDQLLPLMREDLEKAKARAEGRRHPLKPKAQRKTKAQAKAVKQVTFRFDQDRVRFCRRLLWEKGAQLEAAILAGEIEESEAWGQQNMISDILSQLDTALQKFSTPESKA